MSQPLPKPHFDPAPIFEHFRGNHAHELLTAAVCHLHLFDKIQDAPKSFDELRHELQLQPRPANVLFTALRAMGLLLLNEDGLYQLAPLAVEFLCINSPFQITGYLGLAAESPGVLGMLERLLTNKPMGSKEEESGAAFIFKDGEKSAMEEENAARHFTLALAGRANAVAPVLAEQIDLTDSKLLLDVGGGTGIYSIALLKKYPHLNALVFDRPEVLKIADEFVIKHNVKDRITLQPGDMFQDHLPMDMDTVLLSNVLHDWDIPECKQLTQRCADALPSGGKILIHDVLLDDDLGGPLPIALYSASLFSFTEGRAYCYAEYTAWLHDAGFSDCNISPTTAHCHVISAVKV